MNSFTTPDITDKHQKAKMIASFNEWMKDYKPGQNPELDSAILQMQPKKKFRKKK